MIAKKQFGYTAFGLNILSEIPLLELNQITSNVEKYEVVIELSELAPKWMKHVSGKEHILLANELVMIKIPNSAIFGVSGGNRILVSPIDGYNEDELRLYLLGTCMGVLLMQRKVLPLHGSAVAINGKVYAFVGDSGAGKSTLASAFLQRGYQLLSDDIVPVTISNHDVPIVTPSYPQQKLWKESLEHYNMEITQFRPIYQRETKFNVPIVSNFYNKPLPLAGIFELIKGDGEEIVVNRIERIKKLRTFLLHTYRNFIIPQLGMVEWHFKTVSNVISNIDMYQLQRPNTGFTAHKLVDSIINSLKEGQSA